MIWSCNNILQQQSSSKTASSAEPSRVESMVAPFLVSSIVVNVSQTVTFFFQSEYKFDFCSSGCVLLLAEDM